jgi:hypothetical protein
MLNIPSNPRVRTRIPVSMWVVAGLITLFSIVNSMVHPSLDRPTLVSESTKPAILADAHSATFETATTYVIRLF